MPEKTSSNDVVIGQMDAIVKEAMTKLSDLSTDLHNQGFHKASAHVANLRWRVERSFDQTIDQVMEEA